MRAIVLIILTVIATEVYPQADRKYIRKGNGDYKEGNYQQSELEYRKALEKDPASFKAEYNLGNALYRQKQYDAATARYAGLAEKATDKQELSRYQYNLGNTLYENRKFAESAEAYKKALRNNPADMDAKHNLQLALKMLNEQKQQDQNNKQQGEDQQQEQDGKQQQEDKQQQSRQQDQEQKKEDNQPSEQPQNKKDEISPADAERILQALENEEKNVMKKVQEQKERGKKVQVDKNW